MKKRFLNCLAIILFFIFQHFSLYSQSIKNYGKVTGVLSDETLAPVSFASLGLLKAKDSTVVKGSLTDELGYFKFEGVPYGTYILIAGYTGYEKLYTDTFKIDSVHEVFTFDKIKLLKSSNQLNTVTILGTKPFVERKIDKTVLNVENSILAAGNTALEILQRAPGVSVDGSGRIGLKGRQGVLIMIDDKPTYLSSEQLLTLLRSTDGNSIQTIELITNPSAKYDAAGNSGIINIKLKKNREYGTNGSVRIGGGYGKNYKSSAALNLNHREKDFNVFGSYNFSDYKSETKLKLLRDNSPSDELTYFDQDGRSLGRYSNHTFKAGVDYFVNKNNTIGFVANGRSANSDILSENHTFIGSKPNTVDSSIVANNPTRGEYSNIGYNLNYKSILDTLGQELNADFDYSRYNSKRNNNYNNIFLNAAGQEFKDRNIFRNATPSVVSIWSGKVDYNYAFNESLKLESGLKSSVVETDNDFQFENLINNQWVNNTNRSNQFLYRENINAAYFSLNKKFESLTLQFGLRAEQTNSKGNSITEQRIVKRDYLDFFPSFFANQVLSKNHQAGFSYSRRIDRPDYGSLNPFVEFVDLYTFEQGNPFLNPQYTNSFELSYSYKETINATLGYSKTRDVISTVLLSDPVQKTLYVTQQNLASEENYNLNISSPLALAKFWNTDNSLTLFYNKYKSPNLMGAPYQSGKFTFQFDSNHAIKINSTLNAELSGSYMSYQVYGTYGIKPIYSIDMGLSKSFAHKNGSIKLSVNDIFNTNVADITSRIPLQNYHLHQKDETRVYRLSLSYRFGSKEIKGPNNKTKGSSDEEKRVKTN
ncbi:TonB-dependent receptor domain-containing protein [Pedobacter sp. AW31-3R]|uniref:TonB-dependent receptor domain-containing protein n=1 Tax=Pedobacter sp. AW31-3R TaxID=3445781 RepID=UPI003FA03A5A